MITFFRFLISKVFVINILIALLLISGGLYATLSYLDDYTLHGKAIKVPKLKGAMLAEVDSLLGTDDFSAVITDSIYHREQEGGLILEQDPYPGYEVKQGRKIYLTISAYSAPKVLMPNLVDLSMRQAISLMETYGLEVGELTYKADLCSNCILKQLVDGEKIAEGEEVSKGAIIDLVVGQGLGNRLVTVPYLIDFSADMAEHLLKAQYLNVGSLNYDETVQTAEDTADAKVYRQIPFYSDLPRIHLGGSVELYLTIDTNRILHTVSPVDSLK